jgi:MtN3 and saliva related transmembrane protein
MADPMTELLGSAAGVCTTLAFVPQLVRVYQTRSTRDISLGMFMVFCTGIVLWLAYGLRVGAMPIIAANGVTLVLAGAILVAKLRFG